MATKTLLLMRHAKSSWKNPELEDFDRPLNSRGRHAAERIGRLMREQCLKPDLVLCSSACRARETAELVFHHWDVVPEIRFRPDLYHAEPARLADLISQVTEPASSLMVIGHNPGMELFLEELTGIASRFPTGALAAIPLALSDWSQFDKTTRGTLSRLWRPRELD